MTTLERSTVTGTEQPETRLAALYDLIERPAWHEHAACRGAGPDLFFNPARQSEAQAVCAACPVRDECRRAAADNDETAGVWAGEPIQSDIADRMIALVGQRPWALTMSELVDQVTGSRTAKQIVARELIASGRLTGRHQRRLYGDRKRTVAVYGLPFHWDVV